MPHTAVLPIKLYPPLNIKIMKYKFIIKGKYCLNLNKLKVE